MAEKHHTEMKSLNDHSNISYMLTKLTDTRSNTEKKEEKLTYISYKLSTYEDLLEKMNTKETHL